MSSFNACVPALTQFFSRFLVTVSTANGSVSVDNQGTKAFDDLVALAEASNPVVKYFDPMSLAEYGGWLLGGGSGGHNWVPSSQ